MEWKLLQKQNSRVKKRALSAEVLKLSIKAKAKLKLRLKRRKLKQHEEQKLCTMLGNVRITNGGTTIASSASFSTVFTYLSCATVPITVPISRDGLQSLECVTSETCADSDAHRLIYEKLTSDITADLGSSAASTDRECLKRFMKGDSSLVYGELGYDAFTHVLRKIFDDKLVLLKPGQGTFLDLGSGTGKLVFAAAIFHAFRICKGVELLGNLHRLALSLLHKWNRDAKYRLKACRELSMSSGDVSSLHETDICFIQSDFRSQDYANADIIYVATTCFNNSMMHDIASIVENTRVGTVLITTAGKIIPSKRWRVAMVFKDIVTDWGLSKLIVHEKVA